MISKHILDYCEQCQTQIVVCATCHNNCCNGTYGMINGSYCPDCPDAYDMQDLLWQNQDISFNGVKD